MVIFLHQYRYYTTKCTGVWLSMPHELSCLCLNSNFNVSIMFSQWQGQGKVSSRQAWQGQGPSDSECHAMPVQWMFVKIILKIALHSLEIIYSGDPLTILNTQI